MPSLLEDWRLVCRDYPSPENFIDAGFYFLVGAALQRRVWIGGLDTKPIFPNPYALLVATPGVGKGLVTEDIKKILMSFPYRPERRNGESILSGKKHKEEIPLLFPVGADSGSYEAMVEETAATCRIVEYQPKTPADSGIYYHNSVTFVLDEVTSIFKKHSNDTVDFLVTAYTGAPYRRRTIGRDNDIIRNSCVSLIGGTQPDRLVSIAKDAIISSGFLARTILLYGAKNRFEKARIPGHDAEQTSARIRISSHIHSLAKCFGEQSLSPEADREFVDWWENPARTGEKRVNKSSKLDDYYVRKNIQVQKIAMILHFIESTEPRPIEKDKITAAVAILNGWEVDMHKCFGAGGRNELAVVGYEIVKLIGREGPQSETDLLVEFTDHVTSGELREVLADLIIMGKIQQRGDRFERTTKI